MIQFGHLVSAAPLEHEYHHEKPNHQKNEMKRIDNHEPAGAKSASDIQIDHSE